MSPRVVSEGETVSRPSKCFPRRIAVWTPCSASPSLPISFIRKQSIRSCSRSPAPADATHRAMTWAPEGMGEAARLAKIWLQSIATDKGARRYGNEKLSAQSAPYPALFPVRGRLPPAHRSLGLSAPQRRGDDTTASGTFPSWRKPQRLFPTPVVSWLPPAPPPTRGQPATLSALLAGKQGGCQA
jgi:hypothetical protein